MSWNVALHSFSFTCTNSTTKITMRPNKTFTSKHVKVCSHCHMFENFHAISPSPYRATAAESVPKRTDFLVTP